MHQSRTTRTRHPEVTYPRGIHRLSRHQKDTSLSLSLPKGRRSRLRHKQVTLTAEDNMAKDSKIGTPDDFKGDASKVQEFITSCELYFAANPERYTTNAKKIIFALSLLWTLFLLCYLVYFFLFFSFTVFLVRWCIPGLRLNPFSLKSQ